MKILKPIIALLTIVLVVIACQKEYSLDTAKNPGALATGSLKDSLGDCQPIVINGKYVVDSTLQATTHYVTVQVNVDTIGNYVISNDVQNGYSFKDSGYFSTPGLKTITLKGSGKPIQAATSAFTVTFDTSYCMFQITATGAGTGGGGGGGGGGSTDTTNTNLTAWQFTEGTKTQNGPFYDVFRDTSYSAGYLLTMIGYTPATADSALEIDILFPSTGPAPGTYSTTSAGAFYYDDYTNQASPTTIYEADPTVTGANISIVVTSYNATTKIIQGTFTGTAKNKAGATVTITGGKFKGKVR
jgi:hypothetical protein